MATTRYVVSVNVATGLIQSLQRLGPSGELVDRTGIELPEELSGQRGATAAPRCAGERADRTRRDRLGTDSEPHFAARVPSGGE